MSRFNVTIDGDDVEIAVGSLSILETLNGRNELSCTVRSIDDDLRTDQGQEILAYDEADLVFAGNVDHPSELAIDNQLVDPFETQVHAPDFNALAERRTVLNGGFPAGFLLKAAATSLVGFLAPYGVTLHPDQADGPALPLLVFDEKRVDAWFNELSDATGWPWNIDYLKRLRFFEIGDIAAPFDINDDHTVGDILVDQSDENYANRIVMVCGPKGFQKRIPQTWIANGSDTAWLADVPAASVLDLPEDLSSCISAARSALTAAQAVPAAHAEAGDTEDALSLAHTAASSALTAAQGSPSDGGLRSALEAALGDLNTALVPAIAALTAASTAIDAASADPATEAILDGLDAALQAVQDDKTSLAAREALRDAVSDVLTVLSAEIGDPPAPDALTQAVTDLTAAVTGGEITAALAEADVAIQEARSALEIQQALLDAYDNLVAVRTVGLAADPGYVTVNGVFRTVGPGASYEWDRDTKTLSLGSDSTPADGVVIVLVYEAVYPFTVQSPLAADEPSAAQTAYGGVRERVVQGPTVEDPQTKDATPIAPAVAQSLANTQRAQAEVVQRTIRYDTFDAGLHPGQLQSVISTPRGLNLTMLITEVRATDIDGETMRYSITGVEGSVYTDWRDYYRGLSGDGGGGGSSSSGGGAGGGGGVTVLSSPVHLGGSDLGSVSAPDWTRVSSATPYFSTAAFLGKVRLELWTRDSGVGVTARLYNVTDDTAVESGEVTSQTRTPVAFLVSIAATKEYILQVKVTTGSGGVYANAGQLEAT